MNPISGIALKAFFVGLLGGCPKTRAALGL
jgi:hypothetical protein